MKNRLLSLLTDLIDHDADRSITLHLVLGGVLTEFKSETGTIHLLDAERQELHLAAQAGLPSTLIELVKLIPVGKGIAGQTVAQGRPVSICNIQKDKSGVTQAGAKPTGVGGALCVPLRKDGVIVGTVGVGTAREREYTAEETRLLEEVGQEVGKFTGGWRP